MTCSILSRIAGFASLPCWAGATRRARGGPPGAVAPAAGHPVVSRRPRAPRGWALFFLLAGTALGAAPVVHPDHVDLPPNPAAVAYKKEITRDPATWQWNLPLALPLVTHGVIRSASMRREVGYNIYLPPGYAAEPALRYPVVYYCHGATGSESSDTSVARVIDAQIGKGHIGPVICVFVNAGHYGGYRDRPEVNVMAETLIVRELIPEIDRRYRTLAAREGRVLLGFSMGGGGAVRLALKYPDLFCAAASFGGALGPDPAAATPDRVSDGEDAYHWATANQAKIKGRVGLFFVVGQEDRMFPLHAPFLQHLHGLGLAFDYRVLGGVGHDLWGSMARCGGEAMRFLASRWMPARMASIPAP